MTIVMQFQKFAKPICCDTFGSETEGRVAHTSLTQLVLGHCCSLRSWSDSRCRTFLGDLPCSSFG